MVPKEMNYLVPGAQGNSTTCTAQGFLFSIGSTAANLYNCSVCFYYLSIIRYNKNDDYIRNKLEPWFHGISILFPLVCGLIFISMKAYNVYELVCFRLPNNPPHCIGYESGDTPEGAFSIPCGRGDGGENPILYLVTAIGGFGSVLIITPTVIFGTMLLMYRTVSKIEERMRKYGVSALRLSARSGAGNRGDNAETNSTHGANNQGIMSRIKRFFMCMIPPCLHRDDQPRPASRSNRSMSQKRAILHMATGYALAWTLVWIPFMIYIFLPHESYELYILAGCLVPLQGFFNVLVFMSPKVRSAKQSRRGENLSWRRASIKAYMSRGERRKTGRNLSSGNTRTCTSRVSVWKQRVQRFLKSLLIRTSTRDTSRSNESNNASTTTNHQRSSNPEQDSAPSEKLMPLSNPHLHDDVADDMKEDVEDNSMRPQHQELVTDEEEK
jgi:hypothetical protein